MVMLFAPLGTVVRVSVRSLPSPNTSPQVNTDEVALSREYVAVLVLIGVGRP